MRSLLSALLALLLLPLALALSSTGPRVLVVLDEPAHEARYSRLFGALRNDLGLELAVRGARDDKPRLTEFGQRSFDHLLLLAPAAKGECGHLSRCSGVRSVLLELLWSCRGRRCSKA